MELSERTKRVIAWREHFELLPDDQFLTIMHTYLGMIKTPYNKQKLIEALSSFLRKEEIQKNIVSLLCTQDRQIVSCVSFISGMTEKKLSALFADTQLASVLHERLVNLEERLVLFRLRNERDGVYAVNPLLDDALASVLSLDTLFACKNVQPVKQNGFYVLTDALLASFVNYVFSHPDCCKADGSFKKKTVDDLSQLYTTVPALSVLCKAFCELSLFHQAEKEISVDWDRLLLFSRMNPLVRSSYVAAASSGHLSRSDLRVKAQSIQTLLSSIPEQGLSRKALVRLCQVLQELQGSTLSTGRFATLLRNSENVSSDFSFASCVDSCIVMGIVQQVGQDAKGEALYAPFSDALSNAVSVSDVHVMEIDASGRVTLMPGLSLEQLLPLVQCLSLQQVDVAMTYAIEKHSVFRAFARGFTDKTLLETLSRFCRYEIPQTVRVSVEEWYAAYTSVMLYKGYVLCVSQKMSAVILNTPELSCHVVKELASGVFLFDFNSDEEAEEVLQKIHLDEVGVVSLANRKTQVLPLPSLQEPSVLHIEPSLSDSAFDESKTVLSQLEKKLASLSTTSDQKEILTERLERRIIVSESQLNPDCVRFERREATGMDYVGKMHIVETALQTQELLEILVDPQLPAVRGYPLEILDKKTSEAQVRLKLASGEIQDILIGPALKIRKTKLPLDFN